MMLQLLSAHYLSPRTENHVLVHSASDSRAESRKPTANLACVLDKVPQGIRKNLAAIEAADTHYRHEGARCHLGFLYFEGESRTLHGFVKKRLEALALDIQEARKIGPSGDTTSTT